jgi:predicted nucleic acid-binding Zn ribbon protein
MIGGLNVAAVAFALAACALAIAVVELLDRVMYWIEDRWNARAARAQPDELRQLLTLLCEQLHERLQQDGTPPRIVINLTAGQWHDVTKR